MHGDHIIEHLIHVFPNGKRHKHLLVYLHFLQSFSHWSLYGRGCFKVVNTNFSTDSVLATLVQLTPSIIMLQNLSLIRHRVWKRFSHCISSCLLLGTLRALLATKSFPSTRYSASYASSKGGIESLSSSSSSDSISSRTLMIITHLFGHWLAIWPLLWHLKHLISLFQEGVSSVLPETSATLVLLSLGRSDFGLI